MVATDRSERCHAWCVDAEAWRDPALAWPAEDLIELAAVAAKCPSPSLLVEATLDRILPRGGVKSWAVVMIDAAGGVHQDPNDTPDPSLSARAVMWLWTSQVDPEVVRGGATYLETWTSERGVEAVACIPLARGGVLESLVAVSMEASSTDAIVQDISRLTLLRYLWAGAAAWGAHVGETDERSQSASQEALTPRQSVILRAMARGLTNGQIAQLIRFSESTVRLESMCIYRHFDVHSRSEAVAAAREAGEL